MISIWFIHLVDHIILINYIYFMGLASKIFLHSQAWLKFVENGMYYIYGCVDKTKLQEMLTLYEIWPSLQIFCGECEDINSRCCQGQSNAQLIIFGGKYS